MQIPEQWEKVTNQELNGLIMVIGAPDTGKTTFSQYLQERLANGHNRIGFIDGDPGQSRLGPPTTMTLQIDSVRWRVFVGATSPVRHMLQMFVGIKRLLDKARDLGISAIIYDTTGLINSKQGGLNFKQAKIEIMKPDVLFALQWNRELETILAPFKKSNRVKIIDVKPSMAATNRDMYMRRRYRRLQFTRYFGNSQEITIEWAKLGVFPRPFFTKHGLVALEDAQGFVNALGIVMNVEPQSRRVTLKIPEKALRDINALRVGSTKVDPISFEDQRI